MRNAVFDDVRVETRILELKSHEFSLVLFPTIQATSVKCPAFSYTRAYDYLTFEFIPDWEIFGLGLQAMQRQR
jgi:hypothetical protein